ncbi:PRC-barrel domain-containing protein [Skermanella rosea]|uniref:PRC-barrel domain-containing protein n=1 Tax=Skermanella rosea TaxID=1817965 RepID=UPI00193377B3|nr:PRC-barrel domain-containing protein [Skermanella rosea]UEM04324.1 PRC-barrel domain-containing protein [Skermanella rosea]
MRKELIGAASAIALMTGAAFAQGTSTTDPSATPAVPPAAVDGMPATGAVSAEEMIGEDVVGSDGEEIGSVEDVIIDPASGEPRQLVIASGGFLGIGEKRISVDFSQVQVQTEDDGEPESLTLSNMTQADVEAMPEFQYSDTMTTLNRSGDAGMSGSTATTRGAEGESGNMGAGGMTGGTGGTGATTGGGSSQ